ncbi:DNA polymerase III subunit gamma/tau [Riemerella anatipestifer]|uniref:DNA polymerase III subunit gamma/tau n=1 Tax=Riemerella anatipestifer (strain ATCC 11845 / DSM 15868 / JCM 9532 / NCTC 11014) TaxID=693978 RepID=E4T9K2_RIEAD|nr:DNA polymerase III subunit gamma/tau [Riemerella anatipestifer]ADQ81683.1 DNA polymerase III, subunits gamma and tau [Riemerella anatipestifer ATCC 11845 = DSM 15868]AFD55694.1 DNA polymerase iii, subunits gamma and tau [Riemerella anatipestifer ATCC 11845 = DSM 15868]MRM91728.1 DNA polymerase III subunit gamma/tau [Riemerella anatipestifer]MSN90061.1 DNA polymerase III subunit gamma/tau [Riemerella anatipestifer]SNV55330.1 DNA polymerase III subunit tau [Riemerella anatipestifer]
MENFIVSARKYRPQEFDTVVGQSHITDTLEHAIAENQLAQALLFCGPRGVGKTTCARILARKINEKDGATSEDGFSYNIFELDAASNNSVDDIRELTDQVRYAPQVGKYKVYIIDEVHMLSSQAFNAFLKTLEEPPAHAIFILATTEKHKIIPTILSRCQIYDFKRITIEDIQGHLRKIADKEGISYEDDALFLIAQKADGALRDALSIFDRLVTFTQKNITLAKAAEVLNILDYDQYIKIVGLIHTNDIPNVLVAFNEIVKKGFDPHIFIAGLGNHYRDLMMAQNSSTLNLIEVGEKTKAKYAEQSQKWTAQQLVDAIEICNYADINYKSSKNPRLTVEIALMQLASLTQEIEGAKKKKFLILAPLVKEGAVQKASEKASTVHKENSKNISEVPEIEIKKAKEPILKESVKSSFSIKEAINKTEELQVEEEIKEEELPDGHFSETDLQKEWKHFLKKLAREDMVTFNAVQNFTIEKAEENKICIRYTSESARVEFEKVSPQFFNDFKHKFNNYRVKFDFEKAERVIIKKETKRDLFNKMVEVNPLLKDLQELMQFDFN